MDSNILNKLRLEIEQSIRAAPVPLKPGNNETIQWLGQAGATLKFWAYETNNASVHAEWTFAVSSFESNIVSQIGKSSNSILRILYQAQNDLRIRTVGKINNIFDAGNVFGYFDEIRKLIEEARVELLFVDRYLDADLVSRYLPHVKAGVEVFLLCSKHKSAVASAAEIFGREHNMPIKVRASNKFHDRWLFLDKRRCFLSGNSFSNGAKTDLTALIEGIDGFDELKDKYYSIWDQAHPAL